jgi:two-component SAPR family response regulator
MIKAVIVDDEPPSLQKLEKQLDESGIAEVTGAFSRPAEALDFLCENEADAVFLDVEMPDIDGIELASRILDVRKNIAVVFVTAYNQYAVEAFRVNALDYLLKPVSTSRLMETLGRIVAPKRVPAVCGGLSVRCFGRFRVLAGKEEIKFRTEKAEMLLAFLIDCGGNYVSRNKIIDSLWEDFDGDRAVTHFNTTLHNVKKALLQYGVQISIQYDKGNYRLETGGLDCDYLKFLDFEKKTISVSKETIKRYEETVYLYESEYLSGWEPDWVVGRRLMLEEELIKLLLEMAHYYRNEDNYGEEIRWLKHGLLREPLHRELNYRLIEALLLTHEMMLASKYYDRYQTNLEKIFKTKPDAEFQKLLKRR